VKKELRMWRLRPRRLLPASSDWTVRTFIWNSVLQFFTPAWLSCQLRFSLYFTALSRCLTGMGEVPCTFPHIMPLGKHEFREYRCSGSHTYLHGAQQILPYFAHFSPIRTVTAVLYLGA